MAEEYDGAIDRGLEGVVACTTAISSIVDATLCFRGYTIDDLAENSTFEETVFLLWNDRLPQRTELEDFKNQLSQNMKINDDLIKVLDQLPTENVHPMAWLRTAVSMMALADPESQDMSDEVNQRKAIRLTAKMGTLVTAFERFRNGLQPVSPRVDQSLAWNFLYMLSGKEPDAELVSVFDICLILHADHELNCSAFAARVTSSSLSDMYSAVVSAIGALKGPLHGGANEQVMQMLKEIGEPSRSEDWVTNALQQKKLIMGFGHRVYKQGDPRAKILRRLSEKLTQKVGEPKWFQISEIVENTVRDKKGLLPNVDFYSASVYNSLGIPIDLYTPIFATSRISGWLAHVFEQYSKNRIYRPRGKWVGKQGLNWQPVENR